MKKWNVAIIGLGFVGKLHCDALRRLPMSMCAPLWYTRHRTFRW